MQIRERVRTHTVSFEQEYGKMGAEIKLYCGVRKMP